MDNNFIFIPVLIQVALTFWLYNYLAITKSRAVKKGEVNEARRALYDDAWPDSVVQVNNCIRNQFEIPVLFYVLIGVVWAIGDINIYVHLAAWAFVSSRIGHAVIHTTFNRVPLRRKFFMTGCYILIVIMFFTAYELISS